MSEYEERIEAVGEDGVKYYLPKQSVEIRRPDWKARVIAAGSLLVASGAVIYETARSILETPVQPTTQPGLISTVEAIQTQQAKNLLGDCVNENVAREMFGVDPITLKGCQAERDEWAKKLEKRGTPEPPTAMPGS